MPEDAKDRQLDQFRIPQDDLPMTTDQGVRVDDTDNSLKAGTRGPTIMEDFHFREKI
ncbi:MAG: catalase, partial [Nonomuraea sp.]|nr:catalase [Nonomuraea sp.]NUR88386.1 catalase [Nonomuraea sp.]